ncbi:MAG: DUF1573 domain-containing protein [Bacteroidetes bacterium]|nr:MAG: DUF1573 domain-containing protein [Bacteroidota bacterium]
MNRILIVLLLSLGGTSLFAQQAIPVANGTGIANLEAAPAQGRAVDQWKYRVHDFGKLAPRAEVSYTFEVTNTGDRPLEIREVKPSCSCTVADYTKTPIAPGESGFVTANYHAGTRGRFAKTLMVKMNTEASYTVLRLQGEVVPVE